MLFCVFYQNKAPRKSSVYPKAKMFSRAHTRRRPALKHNTLSKKIRKKNKKQTYRLLYVLLYVFHALKPVVVVVSEISARENINIESEACVNPRTSMYHRDNPLTWGRSTNNNKYILHFVCACHNFFSSGAAALRVTPCQSNDCCSYGRPQSPPPPHRRSIKNV